MASPPASGPRTGGDGTITFLFTDIEGSTRLVQQAGPDYGELLAVHRRLLRSSFTAHHGREIDTQGDSFSVAFTSPSDAVAATVAAQRALAAEHWPPDRRVRVRMGLHTREATAVGDGYVGLEVHRGARIGAVAHGGQVLVSHTTAALVRGRLPAGVELRDLGEHRLKDLDQPERFYQLVIPGLAGDFPARPASAPSDGSPAGSAGSSAGTPRCRPWWPSSRATGCASSRWPAQAASARPASPWRSPTVCKGASRTAWRSRSWHRCPTPARSCWPSARPSGSARPPGATTSTPSCPTCATVSCCSSSTTSST